MDTVKPKRILVTSALPYANGSIHIGHLVEYIQTDIFVRFLKLIGEDAIYCCADDTHGAPISIKAEQLGITPEELIAKFHKEHLEDFSKFLIEFDSYYSTNSPENKKYAELIFQRLKDKGLIYTKDVEQSYCPNCKRFLPDRYVKGTCPKCGAEDQYGDVCEKCNETYNTTDLIDPYCTICKNKPERKISKHYFFKLSKYEEKLSIWLKEHRELQPEIVNYVKNWIKEGLHDWDISRDGPYFGFKIPGEKDKYFYVWLDAPIGYISSTENYCNMHNKKTADYWSSKDSKIIHFIGKDIIYFHFLFWPAMLLGADFRTPDNIVVHGFLTVNGEKMSKSRGTFFTAKEFAEKYNPEYLRYYYAKTLSKKMADIDLDFNDFVNAVNNELVANIGNFCYRVLSFTKKNYDGVIADIDENKELIEEIHHKVDTIKEAFLDANFNVGVKEIFAISALGNKYFQDNAPWKSIKVNKTKTQKVLATCINIAKILCILLKPVVPNIAKQLEEQLGLQDLTWEDINFELKDHKIKDAGILVQKMEEEEKEEKFPLNLKIAKVIDVKAHPNADKLYVFQIDLGTEKRQIVAGIKSKYSIEELKGKNLVVVTNLKPAKLRGEESNGMLLVGAKTHDDFGLLTVEGSPGEVVFFEGLENDTKTIDFKEFTKLKLELKDHKVFFKGKVLKTAKNEVKSEFVSEGNVE